MTCSHNLSLKKVLFFPLINLPFFCLYLDSVLGVKNFHAVFGHYLIIVFLVIVVKFYLIYLGLVLGVLLFHPAIRYLMYIVIYTFLTQSREAHPPIGTASIFNFNFASIWDCLV